MEKDQVTIAVTASGLTGPVGQPILVVCRVQASSHEEFVILRAKPSEMRQRLRIAVAEGPMTNYAVNYLTTEVDSELYVALCQFKGVQAEFESLP